MGKLVQFSDGKGKWYKLALSGEDDDGNPSDYFRCQVLAEMPVLHRLDVMADAMRIMAGRTDADAENPTLLIVEHLLAAVQMTLQNDPGFHGGSK